MAVTFKKLAYEEDIIAKNILEAEGDIIYASASSTPTRLPVGVDNYVLTVIAGIPAWKTTTTGLSNYWQIISTENITVGERIQYLLFNLLDLQGTFILATGAELVVHS